MLTGKTKRQLSIKWGHLRLAIIFLFMSGIKLGGETISFQNEIQPIFQKRCLLCHNETAASGGLVLTTYETLKKGGESGPVVIGGNTNESLLLQMVRGKSPRMPKSGKPLKPTELELIRTWIAEGGRPTGSATQVMKSDEWWSFKPFRRPPVPTGHSSWARTPIDAFIQAQMSKKGLEPSKEADRKTLIRRLMFNLHGLPPTPEEVKTFIKDTSKYAYEKLVNRLLASPRYGERWGRHWLDVVHYGESHGFDKDKPRPNAWPYRDYVIRSFNEDKPYARFVEEQLAGDILFPDNPEGIVATGFIASGPWDFVGHAELREGTVDKKKTRLLDRDDMVATTMSTFTSLTVHCARCHNHKFDPITQEDYYSLQAVFAGVERAERPFDLDPLIGRQRRPLLSKRRTIQADIEPLLSLTGKLTSLKTKKIDKKIKNLQEERSEARDQQKIVVTKSEKLEKEIQRKTQEIDQLKKEQTKLKRSLLDKETLKKLNNLENNLAELNKKLDALPPPKTVYAAANSFKGIGAFSPSWKPRPIHLLKRGNVEAPGKLMGPGAVAAVPGLLARFKTTNPDNEGERRVALAKWITDPNNPLTWRSAVNRIWHYHFGRGIVDSPNDFGRMGGTPTHPNLLNWLAVEFRENGGSFKKLHRLILQSSVYRQTSKNNSLYYHTDSENRFLWRMNRGRLDAESLRDTILFVSGKLDLTQGGPSARQFIFTDDHSPRYNYTGFDVDSAPSFRRSIYRFLVRSVPDPMMEILDCPDPSLLTPKRNSTLTAQQALVLLNNPLMIRQAEHLAKRLQGMHQNLDRQIKKAYLLVFNREPRINESRIMVRLAVKHGLANACRVLLNSNEFMFID